MNNFIVKSTTSTDPSKKGSSNIAFVYLERKSVEWFLYDGALKLFFSYSSPDTYSIDLSENFLKLC